MTLLAVTTYFCIAGSQSASHPGQTKSTVQSTAERFRTNLIERRSEVNVEGVSSGSGRWWCWVLGQHTNDDDDDDDDDTHTQGKRGNRRKQIEIGITAAC